MRKEIITRELYKFDELSETAKERATQELSDINIAMEWWDSTYADAEDAGIKLKGFDLDHYSIKGQFTASAEESAHLIEKNHGETCDTYNTAKQYLANRDKMVDEALRDDDGELEDEYKLDQELDELDQEFLHDILEDYLVILRHEYEYLTSEESIIETIQANEYEFTIDGKLS